MPFFALRNRYPQSGYQALGTAPHELQDSIYQSIRLRGESNIAHRLQLFNDKHLYPAAPGSFVFVKTPDYLLKSSKSRKRAVREKWIFVARLDRCDSRERWTATWVTVIIFITIWLTHTGISSW
jgi:hypothetical protein